RRSPIEAGAETEFLPWRRAGPARPRRRGGNGLPQGDRALPDGSAGVQEPDPALHRGREEPRGDGADFLTRESRADAAVVPGHQRDAQDHRRPRRRPLLGRARPQPLPCRPATASCISRMMSTMLMRRATLLLLAAALFACHRPESAAAPSADKHDVSLVTIDPSRP